ncbi:hypothetical protein ACFE04_031931 [Oxalis oulophora]
MYFEVALQNFRGPDTDISEEAAEIQARQLVNLMNSCVNDHTPKSTRGFLKPSSSTIVAGARLKMVRESSNCTESCIKPLELALQQFKQWVKSIKVKTSFSTRPSSTEIILEPLGVVGDIAAGNSV